MDVVLKETTVGDVGGVDVGCGSFWERSYRLPDGVERTGLTAVLAPFDGERVIVGPGSVVTVGGRSWRVEAIEKVSGTLGRVTLRERAADHVEGLVFDGVDLGGDVERVVADQLATSSLGDVRPDDRSPLDWLGRAYEWLRSTSPDRAAALSRAIASVVGDGEPTLDGLAALWFTRHDRAEGGDALRAALIEDVDRWDPSAPDETVGRYTPLLRQSLLLAAMEWEGAPPSPALLELARSEVLAGDGEPILGAMVRKDTAFVAQNVDTLLALYPGDVASLFLYLLRTGATPDHALDRVLPHADARGLEGLDYTLRASGRVPDAARAALIARVAAAPRGRRR